MSSTPTPSAAMSPTRLIPPHPIDLAGWPVVLHGRTDKTRPVLAGIAIQTKSKGGTIGFCFLSKTGGKRLVTAAHLVSDGIGGQIGQASYNDTIGGVMDIAPPFKDLTVDVAMANVSVDMTANAVLGTDGPYKVTAFCDWTTENDVVQLEGAVSGTTKGKVVHPNAKLTVPELKDEIYAAIATYDSDPGDSGAPVIIVNQSNKACLAGLHGGKVKIKDIWYAWFVPTGTFADWAFPDNR